MASQDKHDLGKYIYCPFCTRKLETRIEEENKIRSYCSQCNWTHYPTPAIAVGGVATKIGLDLKPYVLMVRRNREPFKGSWMFPAGFLESGEHPEDTLPRELKEETGLDIISFKLLRICKSIIDPRSPDHLIIFYLVRVGGDIRNNDKDENLAIEWKSIYDDIDIGFPHHRILFDELRSKISEYWNLDSRRHPQIMEGSPGI